MGELSRRELIAAGAAAGALIALDGSLKCGPIWRTPSIESYRAQARRGPSGGRKSSH